MAEGVVAGIALPPGEPGAVQDAAQGLRGVASGFQGTGATVRAAAGSVSWQGVAASGFMARTGDYGDAAGVAESACVRAAAVLSRFADRLEEGRERVRRLQERAEEAVERRDGAQAAAAEAGEREQAALGRAADNPMDLLPGGEPARLAERASALSDAAEAAGEREAHLDRAAQAQAELDDLRERAEEEREAVKEAATAAAGEMNGAEGGLPVVAGGAMLGRSGAVEGRILTGIRGGDYSVLNGVPLNSLSEDTQSAIGSEIAVDAHEAAGGEGDHSLGEVSGLVERFQGDGDFAVGFYNRLGGGGTNELAQGLVDADTGDYSEFVALAAPFAMTLGTATRAGGLRRGFSNGLLRRDLASDDEERWGTHADLEAFVMAGEASNYAPEFLADFDEEILFAETGPPVDQLRHHQRLIAFTAGNPEASGLLLTGTSEWRGGEYSNSVQLLGAGIWDDDGAALGSLIEAGTHGLRQQALTELDPAAMEVSNNASHAVIQSAPMVDPDFIPAGVKQPLVNIFGDHVEDFEYVATERALPGYVAAPPNSMVGFTYEEGHDYLKMLYADDATRGNTSGVLGDRVGEDMYRAVAEDDSAYANRAGALSEMGVLSAGDADLDAAQASDASEAFVKKAGGTIIGLTPPGKVPAVSGLVSGEVLGELFPADAVEQHLEKQTAAQVDAFGGVKRMSIELQVALGELPSEAGDMVGADGSINPNTIDGPNNDEDVYRVDTDGDGRPDRNLRWDLDHDGRISADEKEITERDLYDASLGPAEAASDGIRELYDVQYQGAHPPDIDDLPLPDGYDNNNPSTFENVWDWPFDSEGENTIADSSGNEVAHQDDMRWDPAERVYRLPVEHADGSGSEIAYYKFEDGWAPAEKVDGEWQPVR